MKTSINARLLMVVFFSGLELAACNVPSRATFKTSSLKWSSPTAWPGGHLPQAGDDVTIPRGEEIVLDVAPPALGGILVEGKLTFADKDMNITAKWIMVHGTLQAGTESQPFTSHLTITLTGTPPENVMNMGTRGIMVMGGTLELHGKSPSPAWTKLSANASSGATTLSLADSVNWASGDQVVIAPTDFYRVGGTEALTLQSVSQNSAVLNTPLQKARWGLLQYISNQGVTLTPTNSVTAKVLDERAEVGNLTRNIVIQGLNDSAWQNDGFGGQIMMMSGAVAHVEGVQLVNMGQAGNLGRYPFHWHVMSYNLSDGTELGDLTGQYFRNSVVSGSSQRCVVIHGTNGVTVQNNICYDIKGHAIFLEDAVERRNTIAGNLVLKVRPPLPGKQLLNHELASSNGGPSGFWLTNPDNTVRGNAVADAQGTGYWLAYPPTSLGLDKNVNIHPDNLEFGVMENNVAHSNLLLGFQLDFPPLDAAGDTDTHLYFPHKGGDPAGAEVPFTINSLTAYKHEVVKATSTGRGPIWDRARRMILKDFIVADNNTIGFQGSSQACLITQALAVGTSLNNATAYSSDSQPVGMASYHSQCDITNNIFVNYPAVPGKSSGAFETDDYYTDGVDKGLVRNVNNVLINTHPGYREPSLNLNAPGQGRENWSLAGALWDPYGLWGAAGNYWVYDNPFLTGGTSCTDVSQPVHHNDKSCVGPYYGITVAKDHGDPYMTFLPMLFTRNDNNTQWFIDDGNCTWRLGMMRNVAFVKNGSYTLTFPAGQFSDDRGTCTPQQLAPQPSAPLQLTVTVSNLLTEQDGFLMAVEFDGSATPTIYETSWLNYNDVPTFPSWAAWKANNPGWASLTGGQYWKPLTATSSQANVTSSDGSLFYQDRANNLVWILVRRRQLATLLADGSDSDVDIYQRVTFVLDSAL